MSIGVFHTLNAVTITLLHTNTQAAATVYNHMGYTKYTWIQGADPMPCLSNRLTKEQPKDTHISTNENEYEEYHQKIMKRGIV